MGSPAIAAKRAPSRSGRSPLTTLPRSPPRSPPRGFTPAPLAATVFLGRGAALYYAEMLCSWQPVVQSDPPVAQMVVFGAVGVPGGPQM